MFRACADPISRGHSSEERGVSREDGSLLTCLFFPEACRWLGCLQDSVQGQESKGGKGVNVYGTQLHSGKSGDGEDRILSFCSLAVCGRLVAGASWLMLLPAIPAWKERPLSAGTDRITDSSSVGRVSTGQLWLPRQNVLWGILEGPCPVWFLWLASLDFQSLPRVQGDCLSTGSLCYRRFLLCGIGNSTDVARKR